MAMIALLQLVLDNNGAPVFVLGNEVDAERASRLLAFGTAELKARSLGDDLRVVLQLGGEVERFVAPHLAESHALNAPNPLVPLLAPKIQFTHALTLGCRHSPPRYSPRPFSWLGLMGFGKLL